MLAEVVLEKEKFVKGKAWLVVMRQLGTLEV
jgi:hypothetical protein